MNPKSDDDLLEIFAHARRSEREDTPAWRPELLEQPRARGGVTWSWALMTASVVVLAFFFTVMQPRHEPRLSEVLPPLFDAPPGELFASVEPVLLSFEAPSDFLLMPHLHSTNP